MKQAIGPGHILQFRQGSNATLDVVYQCYAVQMAFTAYGYLRDRDDSKDAVMEIFNKLMSMDTGQRDRAPGTPEGFRNWLFVITRNHCLDVLKHRKIVMDYRAANSREAVTEPEIDRKWNAQAVKELLEKLPAGEQKVCSLHFEGYSHDEICSSLNISYNTVRNQLSSGKKKIRRYISEGLIVILVLCAHFSTLWNQWI